MNRYDLYRLAQQWSSPGWTNARLFSDRPRYCGSQMSLGVRLLRFGLNQRTPAGQLSFLEPGSGVLVLTTAENVMAQSSTGRAYG